MEPHGLDSDISWFSQSDGEKSFSASLPTCPPGSPDKAETWVAERQPTYCAFFLPNIRLQMEIPFQPWYYCLCGWHLQCVLFSAVIAAPVYSQRAGAVTAAGPNCKILFSVSCCCCHEGPFIMTADLSLSAGLSVRPIPLCWSSSKSAVSHGLVPGSLRVRVWSRRDTCCGRWCCVVS